MDPTRKHEKIKLVEINSYLTCYLCKGYLIDATTISECLHSFCRSCIIKFLQENCYCPVCEVIINKAKPCLKLDKTLQDIVYKLVPQLFVKEMYRRKVFYQSRPALWPKVTPEERGEDTERTIFNPQDAISLSIEYISDDSSPGAIPSLPLQQKTQNNNNKNGGTQTEEPQDNPMKRYLQCPGMCRIDVLKKFVRNKYNVDTNLFHIDILYKRVPLPDHYTLIDIGYIYSWKRNEPMKFFFRITDINKVAERFDYFDGRLSPEIVHHQKPSRIKHNQNSSENKVERNIKSGENNRKNNKETTGHASSNKETKEETKPLTTGVTPSKEEKTSPLIVKKEPDKTKHDLPNEEEEEEAEGGKSVVKKEEVKEEEKEKVSTAVKGEEVSKVTEVKRESANKDESSSTTVCPIKKVNNGEVKSVSKDGDQPPTPVILKPEITEEIKNKIQSDCKNSAVYTNITLNRDDNVEIITKIQKVSNKEGHPIGLNIINHTVKKTNKVQNNNNSNNSVGGGSNSNKSQQKTTNNKPSVPNNTAPAVTTTNNNNSSNSSAGDKTTPLTKNTKKPEISVVNNNINNNKKTDEESKDKDKEKEELEKSNFLKSIELTAKNPPTSPLQSAVQKIESPKMTTSSAHCIPTTSTTNYSPKPLAGSSPKPVTSSSSAKRKNSSPVKVNGDKNHQHQHTENNKKAKIEKKPVKIIIQPKNIQNPAVRQMVSNVNQNVNSMSKIVEQSTTKTTDIQSLIDNCKIPASLSITLNEGGEGGARTPPSIPPVKNYIEILKLPDNNKDKNSKKKEEENKTGEQKTPPPTTTTPSVVKERNNVPTFQKIFEESIIKKASGILNNNNNNNVVKTTATTKSSPLDLTAGGESTGGGGNKRKILEIASQLQKKTKIEQEKAKAATTNHNNNNNKIAIPRLATQRTLKPTATPPNHQSRPQTSASLHSSTLGMNYTVSVSGGGGGGGGGERVKSPEAAKKPSTSKPSPSTKTTPNSKSLSPNQLLEKYNIQNLAQLTAGFNFSPGGAAGFGGAAGLNTALQHAMLLKQIEHQSWLNPGPLLQYEKYLQTLSATQNKIMGNIKEN